jgi:hypothetical protein
MGKTYELLKKQVLASHVKGKSCLRRLRMCDATICKGTYMGLSSSAGIASMQSYECMYMHVWSMCLALFTTCTDGVCFIACFFQLAGYVCACKHTYVHTHIVLHLDTHLCVYLRHERKHETTKQTRLPVF